MKRACRAGIDIHACGDLDTGGSPNVFINGCPAHRLTDGHSHGAEQIEASTDVFANGLGIAREGDSQSADALLHPPNAEVTGSPNVFVN